MGEEADALYEQQLGDYGETWDIPVRWRPGPHLATNWEARKQASVPSRVKVICPVHGCGRHIKASGLYDHMRDKHKEEPTDAN